jgi:hypothetical protein
MSWFDQLFQNPGGVLSGNTQQNTSGTVATTTTNSGTTAAVSNVVIPAAPTMFTGGNLVNSVNASYQNDWLQLQENYKSASEALQLMRSQISRQQSELSDAQGQWNYYEGIVKMWEGRHKGCGPFSEYGCGECEDQADGNAKNREAAQHRMDAANVLIKQYNDQVTQYLQPQVDYASKQLKESYKNYTADVAQAQTQEAKAAAAQAQVAADLKNTEMQSNPAYVAAQTAAKEAAAKLEFEKQKEANKAKLTTYILIAVAVVVVAGLSVVAFRIAKK